jgi:hypothetical protein
MSTPVRVMYAPFPVAIPRGTYGPNPPLVQPGTPIPPALYYMYSATMPPYYNPILQAGVEIYPPPGSGWVPGVPPGTHPNAEFTDPAHLCLAALRAGFGTPDFCQYVPTPIGGY